VTTERSDERAFSQPAPRLGFAGEANFKSGDLLFRDVPRGVGPLLNTQSCQGCHQRDGRGSPPASPDEPLTALLLRLSVVEPDAVRPEPTYGDQLQTLGIDGDGRPRQDGALPRPDAPLGDGAIGEAFAFVRARQVAGSYPDGTPYVLLQPEYAIRDLSYGPFVPGVRLSPRLPPPMIGMGLLEAIPAEDIMARADSSDSDHDGISGRANLVIDGLSGETRLGRFGWKASQPSVLQQVAGAYNGDIGATTSLFSEEACTPAQLACMARAASEEDRNPGGIDVSDLELALVEFYSRHLAVPRRRGWDAASGAWEPPIQRGRELFFGVGCAACHVAKHRTGEAAGSALGDVDLTRLTRPASPRPELSHQTIWPYTDLLLHDMGGACAPLTRETADGDPCASGPDCLWVQRCEGLADGRPDALASETEWRTPPLWGLGLTKVVNPRAGYLHDGRARTLEEAILWHGGEAEESRRRFTELASSERAAMIAFLESQ
jgi:CxxC motif-containing protein (DUF1111 family)